MIGVVNPVGLVERAGHQFMRQNVDRSPLAEQPRDAFGFPAVIEFGHGTTPLVCPTA